MAEGTSISNGSNSFVLKAWNMEQKMEAISGGECSNLILGNVPGGIPTEINSELTSNSDDIPDGAEELTPYVVNGVVKVDLE